MFTNSLVLRSRRGSINELPLVLLILFVIIAFPLIDLLGVAIGAGTALLLADQSVARAASHQRYDTALSAMTSEAQGLLSTGFASFSKMKPIGGNRQTGADLYIVATNYKTNSIRWFEPDSPVTGPIDPSTYLYECTVKTHYQVGPTISFQGVPYLGNVPGLGKPFQLDFQASRPAEYPMGLNQVGDVSSGTDGGGLTIGTISIPWDSANTTSGSSWNFVQLYDIVLSYGLNPTDDDVITVLGNNPTWTKTIFTNSGGQYFFDTRPDGYITLHGSPVQVGPNGTSTKLKNGLPLGALIGMIGTNGQPFLIGSSKFDVKGSGTLYLAVNDGDGPVLGKAPPPPNPAPPNTPYVNNTGMFMVRVISAQ
ncbi:MAG TPA: hypothetical protein V6C81_23755 [Planktothrix sp.]